eukprot:26069-Eustigmatos_ZCMA.PRE.1
MGGHQSVRVRSDRRGEVLGRMVLGCVGCDGELYKAAQPYTARRKTGGKSEEEWEVERQAGVRASGEGHPCTAGGSWWEASGTKH